MPNVDKKKFDDNYGQINWTKKYPKTFKTSWGAEYTVWLPPEEDNSKKKWKEYNSPTLQPTIDELTKQRIETT